MAKKKATRAPATLKKYNQKRDFEKTTEPAGKLKKSKGAPIFVIQRHEASHLHWDFRLELDGVLKSWAVPKEPSMDPSVKRLAVEVEDHPVGYATFHGDIPQGEYGGGHVDIWDNGTWQSLDADPSRAYQDGKLSFELSGKKLGGRWALVRTRNFRGNGRQTSWLLMKAKDDVTASPSHNLAHKTSRSTPRSTPRKSRAKNSPRKSGSTPKGSVTLTHPEKVLFADVGLTKQNLADYLSLVADRMLPHVANRPLAFMRCPAGREKQCFYQQHYQPALGPAIGSVMIKEAGAKKAPHPVITDKQGLQALAQNGVLEVHTWGSAADDIEHPTELVFDFDPDAGVRWPAVIKGIFALKEYLEELKLTPFVKLSGGKGVHVHVPIEPDHAWDEVHALSQNIAEEMQRRKPKLFTVSSSKKTRKGLVYLDFQRNSRGATFVAPYSTRARKGAPVALPIFWKELNAKLKPDHFNLENVAKRLKAVKKDPWADFSISRAKLRL